MVLGMSVWMAAQGSSSKGTFNLHVLGQVGQQRTTTLTGFPKVSQHVDVLISSRGMATWYVHVATKLTKHASERPAVKDTPRSAAAWKQETKVTKKHERTHRDFLNSTYLKIN